MTTSRIGDGGVCTVWQDGDITTSSHVHLRAGETPGSETGEEQGRDAVIFKTLPDILLYGWTLKKIKFLLKKTLLSLFKKPPEYTKSYMVFLLVVQIYVVLVYSYLVLLVRALCACVWFFLLFVCLNHLVCGCKDQEVHFSPPFCRFVGKHWDVIMQCIS